MSRLGPKKEEGVSAGPGEEENHLEKEDSVSAGTSTLASPSRMEEEEEEDVLRQLLHHRRALRAWRELLISPGALRAPDYFS